MKTKAGGFFSIKIESRVGRNPHVSNPNERLISLFFGGNHIMGVAPHAPESQKSPPYLIADKWRTQGTERLVSYATTRSVRTNSSAERDWKMPDARVLVFATFGNVLVLTAAVGTKQSHASGRSCQESDDPFARENGYFSVQKQARKRSIPTLVLPLSSSGRRGRSYGWY